MPCGVLEYLVTVADTGSFTHAAELLMVTQPALSHQIQALEKTFGGPVYERLPRQVRLTPLGRAVLPMPRPHSPRPNGSVHGDAGTHTPPESGDRGAEAHDIFQAGVEDSAQG